MQMQYVVSSDEIVDFAGRPDTFNLNANVCLFTLYTTVLEPKGWNQYTLEETEPAFEDDANWIKAWQILNAFMKAHDLTEMLVVND